MEYPIFEKSYQVDIIHKSVLSVAQLMLALHTSFVIFTYQHMHMLHAEFFVYQNAQSSSQQISSYQITSI